MSIGKLVWLKLQDPEKAFLQGLIQVAAAFYHFQRGNPEGTASLLQGGVTTAGSLFAYIRRNIGDATVRRNSRVVEERYEDSKVRPRPPFPQIQLEDES